MGLLDRLKKVFSSKKEIESIESIQSRFKSIEESFEEPEKTEPTPRKKPKPVAVAASVSDYGEEQAELEAPKVQKESYELGLAAGYTGRSIKEIEGSLGRIESQMVTKDWFTVQLQQLDRRIEDIERALGIIKGAIPTIEQQKAAIIKRMPLTPRMEELLRIVKEAGTISFADLAMKLDLDISDLRSLLSIMTKRTNEIERFRDHRSGWVKYVGENQEPSE